MRKVWFGFLSFFGLPFRKTSISGNSIPEVIHHKFFRLHPNAFNISWHLYQGIYEARFTNSDQVSDIFFKKNGEIVKQFKATSIHKLPKHIIKKITQGTSGYSIVDVLIDEYHDDPKYRITFRKNKNLIETDCDTEGNVIHTVTI
jgi:hypothetical protein